MTRNIFKWSLALTATVFTIIFCFLIVPPLIQNPDIPGAFAAGFVNPFASGYSTDVICCWVILCIWVIYEYPRVKHGWLCLLLGIVPGVVVGLAAYLILRTNQVNEAKDGLN